MKHITSCLALAAAFGLVACSAADIDPILAPPAADAPSSDPGDGHDDPEPGAGEGGGQSASEPDPDPSLPAADAAGFDALRDAAMKRLTQEVSFDAEAGVTFMSDKGVELKIPGYCLHKPAAMKGQLGKPAKGQVDLTFVEIFGRADMVTAHKTTMGQLSETERQMLVSGGQFFMEVRQNGQPLVLGCLARFEIPSSLTGQQLPDPQMQLFNGRIEADTGDLVWDLDREQKAPGETPGVIAGGPSQTNYSMFVQQFGWSNVDRFYSDPRPKTDLLVTVPEGYDDTNSAVYLSYDGEQSGLAHLDRYDDQTGEFSEHYGRIPVGLEAHLVFASESNGQWVYATKSVTITDGAVLSINEPELETGTEAEMLSEIEQLP